VILLLSWIYYSSLIVYYGAAFTVVYARKWGKGVTISPDAVYIVKHETREKPVQKPLL